MHGAGRWATLMEEEESGGMCLLRENSIGPSVAPQKKLSNAGVFNSNCLDSNGKPTAVFQVTFDNAGYSNGKSSTRQCQQRGGGWACPSVSLTGLGILFPPVFSRFLLIAQSVSMRLMLYVRLYTNYHIRRRESTFTLPNKAATPPPTPPPPPQHSAAVRF